MNTVRQQLVLPDSAPTGRGIRVAILDTGVDLDHPDLQGRVNTSLSASFTTKDDLTDRNGHGTHVASIIGGSGAASNGYMRGVAPECDLVVLKISEGSSALEWNAERAIEHALSLGVRVINYSNGYQPNNIGEPPWIWSSELNTLEELFVLADRSGIVCVVAAGNAGPAEGGVTRPGGLDCVLTVGSVDSNGHVLQNSSRGPFRRSRELRRNAVRRYDRDPSAVVTTFSKPDLVAPGEITAARARHCAFDDGNPEITDPLYLKLAGTSQATAVMSGLATLALEKLESEGADLGQTPARTVRRLLAHAGVALSQQRNAAGNGLVLWPSLVATIDDFLTDSGFRNTILSDASLHLL